MVYEFDDFQLDTDRFELLKAGDPVAIEPQVFSLLALLVSNHQRMVSKDEIHDIVWDGRIVSEAALSSRIRSARQAIGDDGKTQRLIRTVHGTGFRFVGELRTNTPLPDSVADHSSTSSDVASKPALRMIERPTIMVLPFANLSGDPEQDYFSDAISADIISILSKYRWLNVIARNTSFGYRNTALNLRELVKEHNLTYLIDGSVRRLGNRVRVNVQLIDVSTGANRWSERYDRDIEDIFEVQDAITETIVGRLEPEIGYAERQKIQRGDSRDLQAWEAYHLGVSHFFKFTSEGNLEAQRMLQKSRELDPNFGEAHAWWAYAVVIGMVYWDTEPSEATLDEALTAAQTALEIDDQNAVFYALKARVQLARREYRSALSGNEIAIRLNSTFAAAHCGLADSLAYEGRYDEAIASFEKAMELSPNDPQRWAFFTYGALAFIFKGDYETAVEWTEQAHEIPNCQYWTSAHQAVALAHLNRMDEAKRAVDRLKKENPDFDLAFAKKKLFYLKRPEQIETYLSGLEKAGLT